MFDTTKDDLKDILSRVESGKLQLPDFQRSYVWGDDDVKSLLASIAKGFPVGALLTLETGGDVQFKPRVLAGVDVVNIEPKELLLDGQQRMTSLFQATFTQKPVRTKTKTEKEVDRHYYLDIKAAISEHADIEDAIVGMPADRILRENFGKDIKLDLSTPDKEYEHNMFPLDRSFDSRDWIYDWRDYCRSIDRDIIDMERTFVRNVLDAIERYKMPIIRLDKDNSREAICLVFEKVNVGGKKLDAFELVTAIYAADEFDLREDWQGTKKKDPNCRLGRIIGYGGQQRNVLLDIASTDFLQACTVLHTRKNRLAAEAKGLKGNELPQISCKRESLLALPLTAYKELNDEVESGFIEASRFINELKIIWYKDVSYPPQLTTLAATLAHLGRDGQTASAKQKLARWYWSVALGELYGSSTESKMSRDVPELINWIKNDGEPPRTVREAMFQEDRLMSLRSRKSAAYKAIHALLMKHGCLDFISGRPTDLMTFFDDKIDIHHIFPQAWCKKQEIDKKIYDSVINKTALSKLTNIMVGGSAPSVYLAKIEKKHGLSPTELDDILRTHLIEPEHLRNDDFESFMASRTASLSGLISDAMGKTVVTTHETNEPEFEITDEDDSGSDEAGELSE